MGYGPQGRKELDTTEGLSAHACMNAWMQVRMQAHKKANNGLTGLRLSPSQQPFSFLFFHFSLVLYFLP